MRRYVSMAATILVCLWLTTGCVNNAQQRTDVAMQEASRMQPTQEILSRYSSFELQAIELRGEVRTDDKKVRAAQDLENRLRDKVIPLLESWNNKRSGDGRTLIIRPVLQGLYIVSPGARFWVGGMAGDSSIDMDLVLIDGASGKQIATARIQRSASAIGGAYSVGGTDRNLPNYIVDIAYQYLLQNYQR